jgi:glyoxylase-like metal-dependent hydrolase (beta-lactamase superfamily II)
MQAVQLADNIYRLPTAPFAFINSFALMEADGSVTLIDCGLRYAPPVLVSSLKNLGKQPQDVQRIVITHAHADHAGGAAAMQRRTGADVLSHDDDAGLLKSGRPSEPDPSRLTGRLLRRVPLGRFEPVSTARTLRDDEVLDVGGGLRVIHTPGHTPGHLSFLHEPTGTLFIGDALRNWGGVLGFPPSAFAADLEQSRQTVRRLGEADFEVAAFNHGPEMRKNAAERLRSFLSRKAS